MSNSPLVSFTRISPNKKPRTGKIIGITPHHTAGVISVEGLGAEFAKPERRASSNYGIGNDGRIGMYVPEDYRAWTSNSTANDNTHITIEVSNCEVGGQWRVSDAAWDSLVALCVDICRRNGIEKLTFTGDKTGNLTMHKMFSATNCPGPYLGGRFQELADTVNKILNESEEDDMTEQEVRKIVQDILNGVDTKPSEWAEGEVEAAKALGITDGSRPQGYLRREEAFALFVRFDAKAVSKTVADAVKAVFEKIKGVL